MYTYSKVDSEYWLKDDRGNVLAASKEICILMGVEGIMYKHGSRENVERSMKKYQEAGYEFYLLSSDNWKIEALNRMLDTTGWLEVKIKNSLYESLVEKTLEVTRTVFVTQPVKEQTIP
jgi:hypothetical protein